MSMTRVTRLCLVRHGETDWNVEHRIQGQQDVSLNATGEAQALSLAAQLAEGHPRPVAVYSSNLQRAHATACTLAAALSLPVNLNPALRERNFGYFEGLTGHEAKERYPEAYVHHMEREVDFDQHGGETLRGFAARALGGLVEILSQHEGQTVLVVTHGGVLDLMYRVVTDRPLSAPRDFALPNCAPNWFRYVRDGAVERWILDGWGDFPANNGDLSPINTN